MPDERYDFLCNMWDPPSKYPAYLWLTDIAGLVKGAHKGDGLGNSFLSHIQVRGQPTGPGFESRLTPRVRQRVASLRHVAPVVTVGSCLHEAVSAQAGALVASAHSETQGFTATRRSLAARPLKVESSYFRAKVSLHLIHRP